MFASFIPAIADILGKRQRYGGFYEGTVGIRLRNILILKLCRNIQSVREVQNVCVTAASVLERFPIFFNNKFAIK